MSRPAPRKSSLSGQSIFTPPAAEAPQEAPAVAPAPSVPAEASQGRTAAQGAAQTASGKKPPKISIYQHPEDSGRTRAAVLALQRYEGSMTLTKFANEAILEKVARVEEQYNGGKPFDPIGTGELPVGRRMGE
ncbi:MULTISPECIES: hypothetical protein [unclassified Microbacterium]|uniref:ParB family protein n=1 Tax=unclassified Microbacterium TaxID=2609290 RepID=UPI001D966F72|nr:MULTISPECIES: hypothetical protein [unclassified Microbacterium]MBT9608217.1 hypothetical protein [Microbacterium sp.]CAH0141840.1 hypothetical protein SRABI128_00322 [Microbacterium sp. Bi128]